jgi:hypothetical protein
LKGEKMAKQQNNEDHLFENMNIQGFEQALLEVDTPDTGKLNDELEEPEEDDDDKKGKLGSGAPGKGGKSGKSPGKETKDNTFIVDAQPGDEDEPGDDDKDKAGKDKKTKGGSAPENTEGNESPVYLHAAALQEQGVLPNFDLKVLEGLDPEEGILKINEHIQNQIDESIKEGIDEYKGTIGEKARQFIDDLEKGIPFEDLANNYSLEERYGSISIKSLEADESMQEQIYADSLSLKGFSDAKIKKMVDYAKEKEILLEESTDGLKEIQSTIENERKEVRLAADQEKRDREKRNNDTKTLIQNTVKSTKEIIPGIELTEDDKKDLVKYLTIPVNFTNKDGKVIPMSAAMATRAKDPVNFELRLAYFVKNGFFDAKIKDGAFDIFTKKLETSATKKLTAILSGEKKTTGKPVTEIQKDNERKQKDEDKTGFVFPQQIFNR